MIFKTMKNIQAVVHERNDAFYRLETGEGADPPTRTVTSFMGFTYKYCFPVLVLHMLYIIFALYFKCVYASRKQAEEHLEPPNETNKEYEVPYLDGDAYMMQKLWKEKEFMKERDRFVTFFTCIGFCFYYGFYLYLFALEKILKITARW